MSLSIARAWPSKFCAPAQRAFQQARSAHTKRTIQVQLKDDVPGLGMFGSVQTVSPGRMRNLLYPLGKADYILRGVGPRLLLRPENSTSESDNGRTDLAKLTERLLALPPLIFRRRVRTRAATSTLKPIYGSVTTTEISQYISEHFKFLLAPPDAILMLPAVGNIRPTKLKALGTYEVEVLLRDGQTVTITVQVDEQVD
ncbi:hypothetical protein BOTBODRAFT_63915 [Botryobasidium botryosum FD-172 SS1]|uniref:50S ribosomal protein L9, chloroplastic n=1 Tax=Botryobasidium botryosum (strain FD-172 SS1) TaxID=930990 RepID=A0A067MU50_BOTB1|nr:hypothetical protein BOTBODRAFT_63915 [Botryobasidium botryosum FD-172 SS1]